MRNNPQPVPEPQARPSISDKLGTVEPTHSTWRARQNARIDRFLLPKFLQNKPYLRRWIFSFLITVPISGFILMHIPLEPRRVTGPSMQPTINPTCNSDTDPLYSPTWVIIQKWSPNTYRDTQRRMDRGEEVVTRYSRGDLIVYTTPHDPSRVALKRVVGLAGDSVTPIPGYAGQSNPEPVIIPYNHVWVEGDINDRAKSIDSNYFGPISQHLIKGRVIAMWSPWWNIFSIHSPPSAKSYTYPALAQHRVTENAVQAAQVDPNHADSLKPFEREMGEKTLRLLRSQPVQLEQRFLADENYQQQVLRTYQKGKSVAKNHHEPETRERARTILRELERVIGRDALKEAARPKKGSKRWTPESEDVADWEGGKAEASGLDFKDVEVVYGDGREAERKARETPAKKALREMLEEKKRYGEMIDREIEERDKARVVRGV